jgi:hypothetical protein
MQRTLCFDNDLARREIPVTPEENCLLGAVEI